MVDVPKCQFQIGDRVEEAEQLGLSKVIDVRVDDQGCHYFLRQYAHPHKMIWTDAYHVTTPSERRHDPKYEDTHYY